ncbi:hypothetical protein GCM10010299_14090 [Streptomyces tanashiensis]|nr:hypothetical protein GCM10010299_14090 [Streptomyces tanashiensis]
MQTRASVTPWTTFAPRSWPWRAYPNLPRCRGEGLLLTTAGTSATLGPSSARHDALPRRVRLRVAATITCNVIAAIVALAAGVIASPTALIGFGLDSVIEVSSVAAVA